jgi:uncharacterized protein
VLALGELNVLRMRLVNLLAGILLACATGAATAQSIPLEDLTFMKKLRLARAGDDVAQLAVAMHYELGVEARLDAQQAVRWYREASLKGNLEAQFRLAKLVSTGAKGLAVDKDAALKLFQFGAEKGHAASQNALGLALQKGEGIAADPVKAAEWYKKASDQGFVTAQVNLGLLLVKGTGIAQNYEEAAKLFEKAAAQNDAWALNNLGSLYEMGWGVNKDLGKARELYGRAAALGNKLSQVNLQRLTTAGDTTSSNTPPAN